QVYAVLFRQCLNIHRQLYVTFRVVCVRILRRYRALVVPGLPFKVPYQLIIIKLLADDALHT
ncbi:MAG: hypothetical protein KDI36_12680, partial [Pseudomonadales bacterium]|nr:hypothetical protein [Pseudomonadales bacterium]